MIMCIAPGLRITSLNRIKSNQIYFSTIFNITFMCALLQFKMYIYNDCKCVVCASHSHMIPYGCLPEMPVCNKTVNNKKTVK